MCIILAWQLGQEGHGHACQEWQQTPHGTPHPVSHPKGASITRLAYGSGHDLEKPTLGLLANAKSLPRPRVARSAAAERREGAVDAAAVGVVRLVDHKALADKLQGLSIIRIMHVDGP